MAYLLVGGSLLLLGDLLVDVEHPGDVELHTVEVVADHSPQLVQAWVAGLCDLDHRRTFTHLQDRFNDF